MTKNNSEVPKLTEIFRKAAKAETETDEHFLGPLEKMPGFLLSQQEKIIGSESTQNTGDTGNEKVGSKQE